MKKNLTTLEMMNETKRTGKVAIIVEIPEVLEPYKENWLGFGMFFEPKYNRYCVNEWIKHFGYPSFSEEALKNDEIRRDIKWVLSEEVEIVEPLKDCSVGYQYYQ